MSLNCRLHSVWSTLFQACSTIQKRVWLHCKEFTKICNVVRKLETHFGTENPEQKQYFGCYFVQFFNSAISTLSGFLLRIVYWEQARNADRLFQYQHSTDSPWLLDLLITVWMILFSLVFWDTAYKTFYRHINESDHSTQYSFHCVSPEKLLTILDVINILQGFSF